MSLDFLQALFWTIVYLVSIIFAIKYKKNAIPSLAICSNFAWETVALYNTIKAQDSSYILYFHALWFSLDFVILMLYLITLRTVKAKIVISSIISLIIFICYIVFKFDNGMVISSFVIDLLMAILFHYWISKNKRYKYNIFIILIAFFKLLGDISAWLYYYDIVFSIEIIGLFVYILNVLYIYRIIGNKNKLLHVQNMKE